MYASRGKNSSISFRQMSVVDSGGVRPLSLTFGRTLIEKRNTGSGRVSYSSLLFVDLRNFT